MNTQEALEKLFPINRTVCSTGQQQTFDIMRQVSTAEFTVHDVESGTKVYDWIIPQGWDFQYLEIDGFQYDHPLTVAQHSNPTRPIDKYNKGSLALPYRTTYYNDYAEVNINADMWMMIENPFPIVKIHAETGPGLLSYGMQFIPGTQGRAEYLFTTYNCHPYMANDGTSGIVVWLALLEYLQSFTPRNHYRFVIAPETIGALTVLYRHSDLFAQIAGGFVLTCCGGPEGLGYKQTYKEGDAFVDSAVRAAFPSINEYPFSTRGSDERQYSAHPWRIPMGSLHKSKYYCYPEYHTSADNLNLVNGEQIDECIEAYKKVIDVLEHGRRRFMPTCSGEPMLGNRGLYATVGGNNHGEESPHVAVNFHSPDPLARIAINTKLPFSTIKQAAVDLMNEELLEEFE